MSRSAAILGVNAYHGDAAACLVVDGRVVAAAEEERFRRIKHWAGFPSEAVRYVLDEGGVDPHDLEHVALNRDPRANLLRKAIFTLAHRPDLAAVLDRVKNRARVTGFREALAEALQLDAGELRARVHNVEHHHAHLASAFFASPFEAAAAVSVDGFGDFSSTSWGAGEGTRLRVQDRVYFPHSLGLFYLAVTQYLGFPRYGDEYKVMGLAPYGEPRFARQIEELVHHAQHGRFELGLDYFVHHGEGVAMTWEDGAPEIGCAFSKELERLLGPARRPEDPVEDRHADIAASAQLVYEEALFHLLHHVWDTTRSTNLALAGGCAQNSVANGKITQFTEFRDLYVPPAAADAGGAVGAALAVWHDALDGAREHTMTSAALGPSFDDAACARVLEAASSRLAAAGCRVERIDDEVELCEQTARVLADGAVVGWFQGRMEWGPRALGHRSILADPRRADMRERLNEKIKLRETFRPFAPSILHERVGVWFETAPDVPFMSQVLPVLAGRRDEIPAVTHVDGTGRLQTVDAEDEPRYARLIHCFAQLTGVPILLNTSFNENEPIVCRPEEALDCFLRTRMDVLVLENHVVTRPAAEHA